MAMLKKHYESLAHSVRTMRAEGMPDEWVYVVVARLVDVCKEHSGISLNGNMLFDETRFRNACWGRPGGT